MKRKTFEYIGKAILLTGCSVPLAAIAGEGAYVGLEGGANFGRSQSFKIYGYNGLFNVPDGSYVASTKLKTGWLAGAVAGYSFESGLRPEFELDYRRNDFKSGSLRNGSQASDVGGFENADTAMANIWFDFFKSGWVHPYIGGGLGAARVAIRHPAFDQTTNLRSWFDTVFAYQGGAGIGFDLGEHVTLSIDYRYLETERARFNLLNDQPNTSIKADYRTHSAMLGLRYSFGKPAQPVAAPEPPVQVIPVEEPPPAPEPPPPPPCQAPEPGQPINLQGCKTGDTVVLRGVNFLFDKATLTVNAKTLLNQVADALQARADIKVEIDGHTDGKGSVAYNQKLSQRRADSVQQYLLGRGIDGSRMTTRGFGKSKPIADNATDEGREINRRVELTVTDAAANLAPVETETGPVGSDAAPAAP
ncbi:MAG: hypothetical protein JWR16_746 [Nevskia sp.]|nr:hypothetical protein [Nevskia sp.]